MGGGDQVGAPVQRRVDPFAHQVVVGATEHHARDSTRGVFGGVRYCVGDRVRVGGLDRLGEPNAGDLGYGDVWGETLNEAGLVPAAGGGGGGPHRDGGAGFRGGLDRGDR